MTRLIPGAGPRVTLASRKLIRSKTGRVALRWRARGAVGAVARYQVKVGPALVRRARLRRGQDGLPAPQACASRPAATASPSPPTTPPGAPLATRSGKVKVAKKKHRRASRRPDPSRPSDGRPPQTWVLTGSLENFRATREHGFELIGAKEKRRGMAEQIEPGDRIVFYVTGVKAFGGIVRVTSAMFEDRAKVWPGKPGKADPYPWRFATEPLPCSTRTSSCPPRRSSTGSSTPPSGPPSTGRWPSRASCAPSPTPTPRCWSSSSPRQPPAQRRLTVATVVQLWRRLGFEQKVAAVASVLLIVSTFGPFSMVEAGVILTALGVLALLRARAEGRRFHLPLGDGTVIMAAAGWAALLIVTRLFDRPFGQNVLALACAALLAAAGLRERAIRPRDDVPAPAPPPAGTAAWTTTRSPCRWPATRTPPRRCRRLRGGLPRGPRPQGPPRPR